ncbi:unnamed protein product [Linum trigynum]|uniref:F-box domain-containing protein n=1 Tax=Linum trigynum TaxID=586398 RepID=A0AAV2GD91_9ROSI
MKKVGIPAEITDDILRRLPVECLARFCCLSKSWCDRLSDPSYILQKLSRGGIDPSSTAHQTMIRSGGGLFFSSSSNYVLHSPPPADTFEPLLPAGNNRDPHVQVEAYCNGLFCLSQNDGGFKDLFLWNRATSEIKPIPCPPNIYHSSAAVPWLGLGSLTNTVSRAKVITRNGPWLGFDSESDDYKILWQARTVHSQTDQTRYLVEVYSLRNDSWKMLDDDNDNCGDYHPLLPSYSTPQLRKGKLYWSRLSKEAIKDSSTLFFDSFDMRSEVFERVELPYPTASAKDLSGTSRCLLNEESMVALFEVQDANVTRDPHNPGMSIYDVGVKRDATWEMWVLLKYWVHESWTKLLVVTTPPAYFMGFSRNLECFFKTHYGDDNCVVFDSHTGEFRYLKIMGNEVVTYIPSRMPLQNYDKSIVERNK